MTKAYLGDGVYAEVENNMIKLNTLEDHVIYLEPQVYLALTVFATAVWPPRQVPDQTE